VVSSTPLHCEHLELDFPFSFLSFRPPLSFDLGWTSSSMCLRVEAFVLPPASQFNFWRALMGCTRQQTTCLLIPRSKPAQNEDLSDVLSSPLPIIISPSTSGPPPSLRCWLSKPSESPPQNLCSIKIDTVPCLISHKRKAWLISLHSFPHHHSGFLCLSFSLAFPRTA
jgi:hypothetical protein